MNTLLKNCFKSALVVAVVASVTGVAQASDRSTYSAYTRGYTYNIPETRVNELCGDIDGCHVVIGMYNWNGTRRTASRTFHFYYDRYSRNWRTSVGDREGTTDNNTTQHVFQAWSCYFTDGYYSNWYNHGDINPNFGVLSWNQYNASACRVTLID